MRFRSERERRQFVGAFATEGPRRRANVTLFVTNVLNGTVAQSPAVVNEGTVVRLTLRLKPRHAPVVRDERVIATGFPERTDPDALVVGPTGVALGRHGTLYVADSVDSSIVAIPDAFGRGSAFQGRGPGSRGRGSGGPGSRGHGSHGHGRAVAGGPQQRFHRERHHRGGVRTVFSGPPLNDPLGLTLAPNGDVLAANGNDGNIVEVSPDGSQVTTVGADQAGGAGVLFGLTVPRRVDGIYFVDDGDNTLRLLGP